MWTWELPGQSIGSNLLFIRIHCGGEATGCKSNLKNIGTALEMYSTDCGGAFPLSLGQLTPAYLKEIPRCPHHDADTCSEAFVSFRDAYTVVCKGEWHRSCGYSANYPQYTSTQGLLER